MRRAELYSSGEYDDGARATRGDVRERHASRIDRPLLSLSHASLFAIVSPLARARGLIIDLA